MDSRNCCWFHLLDHKTLIIRFFLMQLWFCYFTSSRVSVWNIVCYIQSSFFSFRYSLKKFKKKKMDIFFFFEKVPSIFCNFFFHIMQLPYLCGPKALNTLIYFIYLFIYFFFFLHVVINFILFRSYLGPSRNVSVFARRFEGGSVKLSCS